MVVQVLLGIIILLLVIALIFAITVYGVTLPLFAQIWVIDLLGPPSILFPTWVGLSGFAATAIIWKTQGSNPRLRETLPGILTAAVGAYVFAGAWKGLKLQHQYYQNQASGLFSNPGSLCYDFVTGCLLWGNSSPYPGQEINAILGAALWYVGIAVWYSGVNRKSLIDMASQYRHDFQQ